MALNFRRRTTDAPAIVHLQLEMINGGTILAISSKSSRDHDSFWKYIIKMNRQKYEWLLLFLIRSVSKGKMNTNPAPWIEQSVRCFMGDERRARAHSRLRSRYYLAIVQNREGYNGCFCVQRTNVLTVELIYPIELACWKETTYSGNRIILLIELKSLINYKLH